MKLIDYIKTLSPSVREAFAERCGTTYGHLKNVAYGYRPCDAGLAIAIEREAGREVLCEELRPDVDWAYLRGTLLNQPQQEAA
ncbi:transcriptional regulator [Chitiniphilus eburneus]|uniref:transcriptional regulator n=1 Tax=Chitiniphilus eburneus TaxID=2571148 RepID=UPI0035D0C3C9